MADRRREHALTQIAALRDAEQAGHRQAVALAMRREQEAAAASLAAYRRTGEAAAAWNAHLADAGFAPELAQALAGALVAHQAEGVAAKEASERARLGHERHVGEWHEGDARRRQAQQLLRDCRRALARSREERRLAEVSDRTALAWWRR